MSRREAVRIGQFEPTPASVAAVRVIVGAHLAGISSACRDVVLLIASELATNAVVHARSRYLVELTIDSVARIEVTDYAQAWSLSPRVIPDVNGGRGLALVAAVSARWGVDRFDDRKVVWAEVALGR